MTIAIYGSRRQEEYLADIADLLSVLAEQGHSIVMHEKLYAYLQSENVAMPSAVELYSDTTPRADYAISIGGDGTFLRTAAWIADTEIPIIGVNTGHLGFLAPFTFADAADAFKSGSIETFKILDRTALQLDMPYNKVEGWPCALNDISILKRDSASMINIAARIDNAPLADYLCDGLIISTPTGSTGYNLSVGGPIVQPGSPSIVLSPIAAHSLSMRPLVIDHTSLLELRVTSRSNSFRISLDGRSFPMPCGASIFITKAPFVVRTVQKPDHNFFVTLREKLLWGATASTR